MAEIRPFAAWTYRRDGGPDISPKIAPPYDVVSEAERERLLARDPDNVVAIELPEGSLDPNAPGNRYETGARRWAEWRERILTRAETPAIYVLEQVWRVGDTEHRRLAFLAALRLEPFSEGVVLPHERTLPKALADRANLLRATRANFSPVFGLFPDPHARTVSLFAEATRGEPLLTAEGEDGVSNRLWGATDPGLVDAVCSAIAGVPVFIADGHHRYTTALAVRDERREAGDPGDGAGPDAPAHDYVLMALVNMDDPGLVVLPTHRVVDAGGPFDEDAFWDTLARTFEVVDAAGHPAEAPAAHGPAPSFLARTRGRIALVRVPEGTDAASLVPGPMSAAWKRLDVTVLQELVLDPFFGVHPDRPESLERLSFVKDAHQALRMVGEHDAAFVLNATRMDQLREVAIGGETMPQKSTYFHPKLPSGLLFRDAG